ncbi:aspartate aminotransferase [Leuconostoc mesenteroides subsp. dextranicum]|uniref:aminotransferase class I/II-fold pyridoxal phosphate-dependent enzyme n=1 Tax=Leuconostoc mesenteroides TaxID=1245 RepID=UPI000680ABE8|nr:aminotransferase class I/II-fold pyridoxal phosphate-dependent enzyme [Leuconostoc mesenteroides]KMY81978.1 aspartate aminotransferase [Leuconostoc mesenteroides subsp. dextranicum]MCM6837995.1 aminotransferase class I/II-fold pyridoxal phosphate-dependent enzyme [Leuconostoc mesenteroides]
MTIPTQPFNSIVLDMAPDKLLDFQLKVRDIPDILRLTFGEPGFAVDERIKQATIDAITNDRSHYAESQGETDLRIAAVAYFNREYHLNYNGPENIIITQGVSEAINVIFQTLLNDNDGLLVPEPAYGPYFSSLDLAHGVRLSIDTTANDFKLTPDMVEETIKNATVPVKAILMNYPTNPTGVTYSRDEIIALAETFTKHNLWVISDEIYSVLTYDQEHVSFAEYIPERTIYINGLSKSHAMTGYRVGFILGQAETIAQLQKTHGTLVFAVPAFVQDAALVALRDVTDTPVKMRDIYRQRRDKVLSQLQALGFDVVEPEGAFYLFAKLPADLGTDGDVFALQLAKEGKVAVIPGSAFSDAAQAYIRISYAASDEDLAEGMKRMTKYIEKVRG